MVEDKMKLEEAKRVLNESGYVLKESSDGWDLEKFSDMESVLDICDQLSYELRNCRRGVYTDANTFAELGEWIKDNVVEPLNAIADDMIEFGGDEE